MKRGTLDTSRCLIFIPAVSITRRDKTLAMARDKVAAFLQANAHELNIGQLRLMLGELIKNTLDHNDQGATLEMTVADEELSFVYCENVPPADGASLLARMCSNVHVSRLAGNGVNFGVGLNLVRACASGMGGTLDAAVEGAVARLTGVGRPDYATAHSRNGALTVTGRIGLR